MSHIFIEFLKEYIKDLMSGLRCDNQHKKTDNNISTKYQIKRDLPPIPKSALDLCNRMQAEGRPVKPNKSSDKN